MSLEGNQKMTEFESNEHGVLHVPTTQASLGCKYLISSIEFMHATPDPARKSGRIPQSKRSLIRKRGSDVDSGGTRRRMELTRVTIDRTGSSHVH